MSAPPVDLRELEGGIVVAVMQDRQGKNAFTDEMTLALLDTFTAIAANEAWKVAILTGYESYFCTGGTRDGLLALHEGRARFADTGLYRLALDCPIPVIAAMQGHAIGGGFVLGMFADLAVLSRESIYATNFMSYGFTPGMGATWAVPARLGPALGHEMLFTGRNYRGQELKERGVAFPILPRAEVMERALETARQLADKPRTSLLALKRHLTAAARAELPAIVERELAMHAETFHQDEVRARIVEAFRS